MTEPESEQKQTARTEHIRMRVLLPMTLAFLLILVLAGLSAYAYFWQQEQHQNHAIALRVQQGFESEFRNDTDRFTGLIRLIGNNPDIRHAWQKHDREALLRTSLPLYQTLQTSFGISHLYFHDADGVNFLRVHQPDRHGDPIPRETLRQARETGQLSSGLELGLFGQFVLRVVQPWVVEGKLLGYLELGHEIDHIGNRIKQVTGSDLITFINKKELLREEWETTRIARQSPWERFPEWVVASTTLAEIPSAIGSQLQFEHQMNNDLQLTFSQGDRAVFATAYPLHDAANREVGFMLVLRDVTDARSQVLGIIGLILGVGLAIGILLVAVFYRYLGNIEQQLSTTYRDLRSWIDKHRDSEQALRINNEKLLISNRELESYSYSIAHDLCAPLRAVTGFSQIIQTEAEGRLNDDDKENLQRIVNAGKHMANMTDDILELARISRSDLRNEEVDLSHIAENILQRLQRAEPQRNVNWHIQPGMKTHGDPRLLGQALNHLLGNAWKYSAKTDVAQISFSRKKEGDKTIFVVKDNGAGFDMKHADQLFHTFHRLHSPDEFTGNGVGLATVARILQRHGGRIWAQAETGKGAEFRFTLGDSQI